LKVKEDLTNALLQARKEALQYAEGTSMQSYGKIFGKDVFTWMNPFDFQLKSTLTSFPFPLTLVFSNQVQLEKLLSTFNTDVWVDKLVLISDSITDDIVEIGGNKCLIAPDYNSLIKENLDASAKQIVLFVFYGPEEERKLMELENYLKMFLTR
jgi:hypothetical protein